MKTKTFLLLCLFLGIGLTQLSAQTLNKGSVLAVSSYATIVLNPDVTMNQYVDWCIKRYIPEFEKAYPGVKMFLMTGDRGEKKYQIGMIWYFESVAVRDKYWPVENDTTMSAAAKAAGEKLTKEIGKEASKYVIGGSERIFTDWIIK
jgi:hypothetical protein